MTALKRFKALAFILALMALIFTLPGPNGPARAAGRVEYYIDVDIDNQIVTIYDAATMDILRQMLCSTGEKLQWTPIGEYRLPKTEKRNDRDPWYEIENVYVRYATRITGPILFHSIPYLEKSVDSIDPDAVERFGFPASHGCVRLRWQDARYIAENCPPGTRVKIRRSGKRDNDLRELLFQESYDASKGFSYESFLGIASQPDVMDRRSMGQAVEDLQYRLRDLGIYDGEPTGIYDSATVKAVRFAQYLMGEDASGLASQEFQRAIYESNAPTAMNIRLDQGVSGPAVQKLIDNLAALRLYDGNSDGVFDVDVAEAVKRFQRAYSYAQDGVATPEVQKAIAYEAERLNEALGGSGYTCQWVDESLTMVRTKAKAGLSLRQSASQNSRQLKLLPVGSTLVLMERGKKWSRVSDGSLQGYIMTDYADFFTQSISSLRYTGADGERRYTVGNSAADYYAGANLPSRTFARYLLAHEQQVEVDDLVSYVTVSTGEDGVSLNLRAEPNTASIVLDTVTDGSRLKVQRRYEGWTQVLWNGQSGFLMNRYLDFWTGPDDALGAEAGAASAATMMGRAVVRNAARSAGVYDHAFLESRVLGHLPPGAQMEVLEIVNDWCRIRYEGHEGYMMAADLEIEDTRLVEDLRA